MVNVWDRFYMYGDEHKGKSLSAAAEVDDVNDVGLSLSPL